MELFRRLRTQGCCAGKYDLDGTEVEFVQSHFVLSHLDYDWRYLRRRNTSAKLNLDSPMIETVCIIIVNGKWKRCGVNGRLAQYGMCFDVKRLYGVEELLDLKFGKIDDLITSIGGRMADNDQRVYMALW